MDSSMDSIDNTLVVDLLDKIAVSVHPDDLNNLSNCNAPLNSIIHNPLFIKNIVYNITYCIKNFTIKSYIEQYGINLNGLLYIVVKKGYLNICESLVSLGATDFDYALIYAAKYGYLQMCKYFISLGIHRNLTLDHAIEQAVNGRHLDVCCYLVSQGAHKHQVLHIAAKKGYLKICKNLVNLGARDFNSALYHAFNLEICKFFVSCGATNFNQALLNAANNGKLDICKYIVSLCNFDVKVFKRALLNAANNGKLDICKYIVSLCNFDVKVFKRALLNAVNNGHLDVCSYLVSLSATHFDRNITC